MALSLLSPRRGDALVVLHLLQPRTRGRQVIYGRIRKAHAIASDATQDEKGVCLILHGNVNQSQRAFSAASLFEWDGVVQQVVRARGKSKERVPQPHERQGPPGAMEQDGRTGRWGVRKGLQG